MPEVSKSEYRDKERQRDKYLRDKAACEDKITNLDEEIADLDRAISRMKVVYNDFKAQTSALKKLMGKNSNFSGKQFNLLIDGEGMSLAGEAKRLQMDTVNNVLDQLEWLRNEKRRQRNEQWGILGTIKSSLEWLGTWLRTNFFNN